MAYIGQQPVVGRYILLDQISGSFNGTTSGFTMSTAGGVQGVKPGLAQNVLLSLGGVIQQPGVDYTISGSGITFTTPPVSGTTFFATVLGDAQSVGTPSDGTVTPASIAAGYDFAFPNVNVTGVTTIASGVAATPSLSITGDADTGIFSPSADTLGFATAGVQRLSIETGEVVVNDGSSDVDFRVESNGQTHMLFVDGGNDRVGIGTSSPTQKLSINGNLQFEANDGVTIGAIESLSVNLNSSGGQSDRVFQIKDNGTARVTFEQAGNVGIGTTSPAQPLDIVTSGADAYIRQSNGTVTGFVGVNNNNSTFDIYTFTNHPTRFFTNNTERLRITAAGKLQVTGTRGGSLQPSDNDTLELYTSASNGNVNTGCGLTFFNHDSSGYEIGSTIQVAKENGTNDNTASYMRFSTRTNGSNPAERMRIDSSGNVGINTTSPTAYGNSQATLVIEDDINPAICWSDTGQTRDWWAVANGSNLSFNYADGGGSGSASNVTTAISMTDSGDVGIGTTSPAHNLDISPSSGAAELKVSGAEGQEASIRLFADQGDDAADIKRLLTDTSGNFKIQHYSGSAFVDSIVINSSGRVGIGTSSPERALVVSDDGAEGFEFFPGSSDTANTLNHYDRVSASFIDIINNADQHIFGRADGEKMRIDSSGRLLVGADSGSYDVEVKKSGNVHILVGSTNAAGATLILDGDSNGDGSGSDYATVGHASSGHLEYKNRKASGDHIFSTTSSDTERVRILSGGGITFNGDTATANALDDYEEGTFTPVYEGSTTAGSYTYGSQAGHYTKIGRLVTVRISLVNINTSSAGTGLAQVGGLPFTAISNQSFETIGPRFDQFNFGGSTTYVVGVINNNSTNMNFYEVRSGSGDNAMAVTAKASDTADLFLVGTYFAA